MSIGTLLRLGEWLRDLSLSGAGGNIAAWGAVLGLTALPAREVRAPLIGESPVNIECRVTERKDLGSHVMYQAEVLAVHVDETHMDSGQKFHLEDANPIVYSHGTYYSLGKKLGTFGYSVKKK